MKKAFLSVTFKAVRPILERVDFAIVALATTAGSASQAQHSNDK